MNVQTKIKTKRYLVYALIIFLAHILQNIVPVFPESLSVRPILLIPVAVCIAMFEGELVGAVAGVFAFITMFDAFMVRLPVEKLTQAFLVVREAVLGKDLKKLRIVEGHTIPEIIGGVITGAGVALLYLEVSPLFPEYVSIFEQF